MLAEQQLCRQPGAPAQEGLTSFQLTAERIRDSSRCPLGSVRGDNEPERTAPASSPGTASQRPRDNQRDRDFSAYLHGRSKEKEPPEHTPLPEPLDPAHPAGYSQVRDHSSRLKGAAGGCPGIQRSFPHPPNRDRSSASASPAAKAPAAKTGRRRATSLRHRLMPSGQNAMSSLETGKRHAASKSCTETRAWCRNQQTLTTW